MMQDEPYEMHVRKFLKRFEYVTNLKNFDRRKNEFTFSNKIYHELLKNLLIIEYKSYYLGIYKAKQFKCQIF
jgi:hypothetical protein